MTRVVDVPACEPLEGRRLLAAAAAAEVPATPWVSIEFRGQSVVARPGEWLLRVGDVRGSPSLQVERLQRAIDRLGSGVELTVERHLGARGRVLVRSAQRTAPKTVLHVLRQLPGFRRLEPNAPLRMLGLPDDPRFNEQYGLHNTGQAGGLADADVDAPEAWDLTTGDASVIVAVIDTGVDHTHPDLAGAIWTNPDEVPGDGIDNDGNGFVDDVRGWDFYQNDADPMDANNHGTHVAGILAAATGNGVGIAGIAPGVKILPLRFLDPLGNGDVGNAIAALNYVVALRQRGHNVRVTNASWGEYAQSQLLYQAIAAQQDVDILVVAAAGNHGRDIDATPYTPAAFDLPGVLSVAATDNRDQLASFSNYGATTVDLAAPGNAILSTYRDGGYGIMNGTSMATPLVSGMAALAFSISPAGTSAATVRQAILDGADPVPSLVGKTVTGRRANALGTLLALPLRVLSTTPAPGATVAEPPDTFVVRLSHPVDAASVQPDDLRINGVPADGVTVTDARTLTFTFATSPVTGVGPQSMTLAAGALARAIDGGPLAAYAGSFGYDPVVMEVVSATAGPLPTIYVDLLLNEPVEAGSVGPEDLVLSRGWVAGAELVTPETVRFWLGGLEAEGPVAWQLAAGALADAHGNPSPALSGEFEVDVVTLAEPAAFAPVAPLGSLAHRSAVVAGRIHVAADEDRFTFRLAAGQRLAARVSATSEGLLPEVELFSPTGISLGSAIAQAGATPPTMATAHLASLPVAEAGVYALAVRGGGGTTGSYALEALLNGIFEVEPATSATNDTTFEAESLDGAFLALPGGAGSIATALGRTERPPGFLPTEAEPNDTPEQANSAARNFVPAPVGRYQLVVSGAIAVVEDADYYDLGTLRAGDELSVSLAGVATPRAGLFDPYVKLFRGTPEAPILVTSDDDSGVGRDALLWRHPVSVDDRYFLRVAPFPNDPLTPDQAGTYELSLLLETTGSPAGGAGGGPGALPEAEPNDGLASAQDVSSLWRPVTHRSRTTGTLGEAGDAVDHLAYPLAAGDVVSVRVAASGGLAARLTLRDPTGAVVAFDDGSTDLAFDDADAVVLAWPVTTPGVHTLEVAAQWGAGQYTAEVLLSTEEPPPPAPLAVRDVYAFSFVGGESFDVGLRSLGGGDGGGGSGVGNLSLELIDARGFSLMATTGSANLTAALEGMVALAGGTHYAVVSGDPDVDYALVVTRSVAFDVEPNYTFLSATELRWTTDAAGNAVAGAVGHAAGEDYYRFAAEPGTAFVVRTFAPGAGEGAPDGGFDAMIELYDPDGLLVASDGDEGPGGPPDAFIAHVATTGGSYRVRVRSAAAPGDYVLTVTDVTAGLRAGAGDDTLVLRRSAEGDGVEVFVNPADPATLAGDSPAYLLPLDLPAPLRLLAGGGDDAIRVDFSRGNPIPDAGLFADGGAGDDSIVFVAGDGLDLSYNPGAEEAGAGTLSAGGREAAFAGVEAVSADAFATVALVTPNPDDDLMISSTGGAGGGAGTVIAGSSGGVPLVPLTVFNVADLVLDAAAHDLADPDPGPGGSSGHGDDEVSVASGVPARLTIRPGRGSNALAFHAGEVNLDAAPTDADGHLSLRADGDAVVRLLSSQTFLALDVAGAARVELSAGGGAKLLTVDTLSIGPGATLDLADHELLVRSGSAEAAAVLATLTALIASARNGGDGPWSGAGLTSGVAHAQAAGQGGAMMSLGIRAGADSVRARYTVAGDADLSGRVDAADYLLIDRGFALGLDGWGNGDFDYSGTAPSADDYLLADRAFVRQFLP